MEGLLSRTNHRFHQTGMSPDSPDDNEGDGDDDGDGNPSHRFERVVDVMVQPLTPLHHLQSII